MTVQKLKELVKDEQFIRYMTTPANINSTRRRLFIEYIKNMIIERYGKQ